MGPAFLTEAFVFVFVFTINPQCNICIIIFNIYYIAADLIIEMAVNLLLYNYKAVLIIVINNY